MLGIGINCLAGLILENCWFAEKSANRPAHPFLSLPLPIFLSSDNSFPPNESHDCDRRDRYHGRVIFVQIRIFRNTIRIENCFIQL